MIVVLFVSVYFISNTLLKSTNNYHGMCIKLRLTNKNVEFNFTRIWEYFKYLY